MSFKIGLIFVAASFVLALAIFIRVDKKTVLPDPIVI